MQISRQELQQLIDEEYSRAILKRRMSLLTEFRGLTNDGNVLTENDEYLQRLIDAEEEI
jgi:hypothetical protein